MRTVLALVALSTACAPAQQTARVQIYVGSRTGKQIPYRVHEFFNRDIKKAYESSFRRNGDGVGIPFGRYSYTLIRNDIKNPTWSVLRGKVEVRSENVWIALCDQNEIAVINGKEVLLEDEGPPITVRGSVPSFRKLSGRVWIRLVNVMTTDASDYPINLNGTFSISAHVGSWTVLLLQDGVAIQSRTLVVETIRGVRTIRLAEPSNVELQLTPSP